MPRSLRPCEMDQLSAMKLAKKASLIYPAPSRLQALSIDGIGPELLFHVPSHDLWFVYFYNARMDRKLATVKGRLRRAFTAAEIESFLNRFGGYYEEESRKRNGEQLSTELLHFLKHQLEKRTDAQLFAYLEALEPHREEGHFIVRLSTNPLSVNENSPGLSPASPLSPPSSFSGITMPPSVFDVLPSPINSPTVMDLGPPVWHKQSDMDARVDTGACVANDKCVDIDTDINTDANVETYDCVDTDTYYINTDYNKEAIAQSLTATADVCATNTDTYINTDANVETYDCVDTDTYYINTDYNKEAIAQSLTATADVGAANTYNPPPPPAMENSWLLIPEDKIGRL